MSLSYNELKHSHNKLAILLYRLSFPEKNDIEYWNKWSKRPLHKFVFTLLRGLGEHQTRLTRIQREQDFIREQSQNIETQLILKEDKDKIRAFFHREYQSLLLAEQRELNQMREFVEKQEAIIHSGLDNLLAEEVAAWKGLLREQYKNIIEELKRMGAEKALKSFKQEFAEQVK